MARMAPPAPRVRRAKTAYLVNPVPRATPARMARLVRKERQARMAKKVLLGWRALLARTASLANLVTCHAPAIHPPSSLKFA